MKVLIVGSSVIDLFLQIDDLSHVVVSDNNATFKIGDKIPVNIKNLTIGGNGANVSVGLKRLGITTELFTYLGQDIFSREIEDSLKKEGIEILLDEKNRGEKSSLSFIFDVATDRIIFSHHEVHNHSFSYQKSSLPDLVFLTSIGNRWQEAYTSVLEFTKKHSATLALNPGSYQLKDKTDLILETIKNTSIIFVNKQEAEKIVSWTGISENTEILSLLQQLKNLGPKMVIITDAGRGAYALDETNNAYHIESLGETFVEKTGAGDAFTSGFLAKKMLSGTLEECMKWGDVNAYYCMQKVGAQNGILNSQQMEDVLRKHEELHANSL